MAQPLGSMDEEARIASGTRYFGEGFGFRPIRGFKSVAGCLGHGQAPLVLKLLTVTFFAVLLVAVLVKVSNITTSKRQEQANKEKIYHEVAQLKARVHGLCRPCPWEWTFFRENCYFFSKSQRNWHESVAACQDVGAQLVVIKSDEEQSFLQRISKEKGRAWMGLSDLKHEGTWHWVDGSHLLFSFMNYWNKGEPNSAGEEDCAEFWGEGWNDAPCALEKFWICKKSAASCSKE